MKARAQVFARSAKTGSRSERLPAAGGKLRPRPGEASQAILLNRKYNWGFAEQSDLLNLKKRQNETFELQKKPHGIKPWSRRNIVNKENLLTEYFLLTAVSVV